MKIIDLTGQKQEQKQKQKQKQKPKKQQKENPKKQEKEKPQKQQQKQKQKPKPKAKAKAKKQVIDLTGQETQKENDKQIQNQKEKQSIFSYPLQLIPEIQEMLQKSQERQYKLSRHAKNKLEEKMSNVKNINEGNYPKNPSLVELVPKENILTNGKDIKMYHGTQLRSWRNIKDTGIKPCGDGTMGKGFYFTPSFDKAVFYSRHSKFPGSMGIGIEAPTVLELIIKDAHKLDVELQVYPLIIPSFMEDVRCKIKGPTLKKPIGAFTNPEGDLWEFLVFKADIIKKHVKINRIYKFNKN